MIVVQSSSPRPGIQTDTLPVVFMCKTQLTTPCSAKILNVWSTASCPHTSYLLFRRIHKFSLNT